MKKLFVFLACGIAAIVLSSCTKSAWDRSYSHKSYVEVGGLKWATKNVGASEDNPYLLISVLKRVVCLSRHITNFLSVASRTD